MNCIEIGEATKLTDAVLRMRTYKGEIKVGKDTEKIWTLYALGT